MLLASSNFSVCCCICKTGIASIQNVKIYKYKEIRQATDDFNPHNKIGEGGFGSVYKVNDKKYQLFCTLLIQNYLIHLFLHF